LVFAFVCARTRSVHHGRLRLWHGIAVGDATLMQAHMARRCCKYDSSEYQRGLGALSE
jgi:hypothetical protein